MKSLLSFGYGYPFFLKVIIPGIVGSFILYPLVCALMFKIGLDIEFSEKYFTKLGLFFTAMVPFIGFILYFLDHTIYRLFEGYKFWPEFIRKYCIKRLNNKIRNRFQTYKNIKNEAKKKILWEWLMRFPLKEKREETEVEAISPTQLGNILSSYESYPKSRYGMNAIFYWPRLWLSLDSETRKEVGRIWAEADCLTYISFIVYANLELEYPVL